MVGIERVIKKAEQGLTHVYLCLGDDGRKYWVKGHKLGRLDQSKEWICARLAREMGLPVADFALVEISDELYQVLPETQKDQLGMGIAFGSVDVGPAQWLEHPGVSVKVPVETAKQVLLFDYWIKNTDRTWLNPNGLWQLDLGELRIIDHNLAFDDEFDEASFFKTHVFAHLKDELFSDLLAKERLDTLRNALRVFHQSIDELPDEWFWHDLEQTRRVEPQFHEWRSILERCELEYFWSMK